MLKFHHIGIASKDIEKDEKYYEKLGYKKAGEYFVDKNQKIRGLFMGAENAPPPTIELVENFGDGTTLNSFLKKGIKMYHIAYSVENIENAADELIKNANAMMISQIKDATYFKKVCFLALPNMQIIEVVEE